MQLTVLSALMSRTGMGRSDGARAELQAVVGVQGLVLKHHNSMSVCMPAAYTGSQGVMDAVC
jgi:hypothetical protein